MARAQIKRKRNLDVRKIRESTKLTQREFAKRLGVCQSTITHWETGRRNPGGPARMILQQFSQSAATV